MSKKLEWHKVLDDKNELQEKYNLQTVESIGSGYDGIIAAVKHDVFQEYSNQKLINISNDKGILIDIKSMYSKFNGMTYWSL